MTTFKLMGTKNCITFTSKQLVRWVLVVAVIVLGLAGIAMFMALQNA